VEIIKKKKKEKTMNNSWINDLFDNYRRYERNSEEKSDHVQKVIGRHIDNISKIIMNSGSSSSSSSSSTGKNKIGSYYYSPLVKGKCSMRNIRTGTYSTSFMKAEDGTKYVDNYTEGAFAAINYVELNNGRVVLGSRKNPSVLTMEDRSFTFKVNNGKLTLISDNGVFINDSKSNVLKRADDGAVVENFYISKDKNYKCFDDDDFEFTIMNEGVMCKKFEKFPKLKVSLPPKKEVKFEEPTQKAEPVKEDFPEELVCKICFENKINTMVLDCAHCCMCSNCARQILSKKKRECPICKKEIKKGIKDMFLS
jgi:hypothetical protein